MNFRFNTGDLVVNMIAGDSMTLGKVYEVVNSYFGHSGCGPQEWCRVADDRGIVSGKDPDRFVPHVPGQPKTTIATALRIHSRVEKLLEGTNKDGPFAQLHSMLRDILEDAEHVVSASAIPAAPNQVVLNKLDRGSGPDIYEVSVARKVLGHVIAKHGAAANEPTYTFIRDRGLKRLRTDNFDIMIAEVKYDLCRAAGDLSLSAWAETQPPAVLGDFHPAHLEPSR